MPVDFPKLHVKNDRDSTVRQRVIPTTSDPQTTSDPPTSISEDTISASPATPPLSLIRRPMHYEPLSRHPISTTLLKIPKNAPLQADDFSARLSMRHQPREMIAYTGCLDGKHHFARIGISHAKEIDVNIRYDRPNGLVQIECHNLTQDRKPPSVFWEKATASTVEDIVESIGNSLIDGCQARKIPISASAYDLVCFHNMDEYYQGIRSHPNFTLAGVCQSHTHRDVTSGAYFP